MSVKLSQLLAIDLGNGVTCYKTAEKSGSFVSLVAEATSNGSGLESSLFRVGKKSYLVGDRCTIETVQARSTDSSYYASEQIKVLFLYGLAEAGIKNPVIITGLPTEFYESHKADLAANLKKWALEAGYHPEGIRIMPQHIGPIMDPDLIDKDGKPVQSDRLAGMIGIMDIGQGTIDVGQMWNGQPSIGKHWGENKGVSDIHKAVLTHFKTPEQPASKRVKGKKVVFPEALARDKQLSVQRIDSYFRQGYVLYQGEKLDIWDITEDIRRDFSAAHVGRAISEMWGVTDGLDGMVVAGGGAIVLGRKILSEQIKCPIYMPKDPGMSIVNGFYNILASKYR